ncbi:MAG: hypothetical protein IT577_15060 [Verrucomicrobiae bacterium]|nr:hypothetical protein [Verrucomicrobiae bacterium]
MGTVLSQSRWSGGMVLAACLFAHGCAAAGPQADASPDQEAPTISPIGDVRAAGRSAYQSRATLSLRGTVTWSSSKEGDVVIDDGTGGIFTQLPGRDSTDSCEATGSVPIGTVLEVTGVIDWSGVAPRLLADSLRSLGSAPLPGAQSVSPSHVQSGEALHQRVRVEGVVQELQATDGRKAFVAIVSADGECNVFLKARTDTELDRLLDSRVRVDGTVTRSLDASGRVTGFLLVASRLDDLTVLEWADPDPFAATLLSLKDLAGRNAGPPPRHRRRVHGTVTYVSGDQGLLYLQRGPHAIRVEAASASSLRLGDVAEASGFVRYPGSSVLLTSASVRKIKSGEPPAPIRIHLPDILAGAQAGAQSDAKRPPNGLLCQVRGTLVELQTHGRGHRLLLGSHGEVVNAVLENDDGDALHAVRRGSELDITGIASFSHDVHFGHGRWAEPTELALLLRDASDVRVIRAGPWWTRQHLTWALLGTGTAAVVSAGWSFFLAGKVKRRTLALATETFARRSLELETEAMLRERNRIAGELHDGVQSLLTGLSFHIEAAAGPGDTSKHIANAQALIVGIREEFRKCVWALRQLGQPETDPARHLRGIAALQHLCSDAQVNVTVEGATDPLPAPVMAPLSLVAREAIANAVTHGAARRIDLLFRRDEDGVTLEISDDGSGFSRDAEPRDTRPRFGLSNMSERMTSLGGTLEIDSRPGAGTRVTARIPASALATRSNSPPKE